MELAVKLADQLNLVEPVDAAVEPSRIVRIAHLAFKCFVMFLLTLIALLGIIYISIRDVLKDEEAGKIMMGTFDLISRVHFPNDTVDRSLALRTVDEINKNKI